MNYNSAKNQQIKQQLVGREVVHCASQMIYELSDSALCNEIFELFYSTQDFDQAKENYLYEKTEEEIEQLLDEYDVSDVDDIDAEKLCDAKGIEPDMIEPYEFWIVTDWFGEKLKEKGEIVADFLGFTIWGRQTTGQAILLDHVISLIAKDMEILEGMSNEW